MGGNDHGPHNIDYETDLIRYIHSSSILAGTKLEIMQHAQLQEVQRYALVPMESKFHLCWIRAVM